MNPYDIPDPNLDFDCWEYTWSTVLPELKEKLSKYVI